MLVSGVGSSNPLLQHSLSSEPVQRVNTVGAGDVAFEQQAKRPGNQEGAVQRREKTAPASDPRNAEIASVIAQLRARDQQVRAHEMAHLAAAGAYATSAARYTYQTGPDGRKYAVGGEVGIDVSPERDPEATIRKMQVVQQAALAPADPSAQDMRVAAAAAQAMMEAMQQLREQQTKGLTSSAETRSETKVTPTSRQEPTSQNEANSLVAAGLAARQAWQQRLQIQQAAG